MTQENRFLILMRRFTLKIFLNTKMWGGYKTIIKNNNLIFFLLLEHNFSNNFIYKSFGYLLEMK